MSVPDLPRYEVSAEELAKWVEIQEDDCYWSVDSDPLLSHSVSFPCPGDELATALRKIGKPLLVFDTCGEAEGKGEIVKADIQASDSKLQFIEKMETESKVDLTEADVIVSGGRGMGGSDYSILEELADLLQAAVGASR